jgi:hypothetical protein
LVKFTIKHKNGKTTLNALASACAATLAAVQVGLAYWEAKGDLSVDYQDDGIRIKAAENVSNADAVEIYNTLITSALEESRAYRTYFQKGDLQYFLSAGIKSGA